MFRAKSTRSRFVLAISFLGLFGIIAGLASCSRPAIMKAVLVSGANSYFFEDDSASKELKLKHLEGPLFVFEHSWNRGMAIRTSKGWVVIDVYGKDTAKDLKAALEKQAPGEPVHLLIYSHYHLDHVVGGAVLRPERILAHEKCAPYWDVLKNPDVLPATETAIGDTRLMVGDVEFELLDLGRSHTDTLFAIHFPKYRTVFGADLAMVKTFPPNGMPDHFRPGFIAALDRVAALDFDRFVPSHFAMGTRADVIDNKEMFHLAQDLAVGAVKKYGFLSNADAGLGPAVNAVFEPLKAKYGHWHGADIFLVPFVLRTLVGVGLGY